MVPFNKKGKMYSLLFFPWIAEKDIAEMIAEDNQQGADRMRLYSTLGWINWLIAIIVAIMVG